jgi:anti-anti-sigma factor
VDIRTAKIGDVTVVALQAENLDASNANEFRRCVAVTVGPKAKIILDLGRVQTIDSTGCGAILSYLRQLSLVGGDLKICNVSKGVQALFDLVRMHYIVAIYQTCDEAVEAFR